MNTARAIPERGRETRTSGEDQGTMFPPELRPSKRKTRVRTRVNAPRKSIRASADLEDCLGGMSITK